MSTPADMLSGLRQTLNSDNSYAWISRYKTHKTIYNNTFYNLSKRIFDIVACTLALLLLSPILLVCILLIKIESPKGSIMFTQQRTGKHGKRFRMYKFRTMVHNAEEMKLKLAHLNELQWPDFKITNDPRITKIGRFMRKTSLDELPQLLNVIKGDMSLVGPRPTSFAADTYQLWQTQRLSVAPGLTGLWQIYGRAQTEFDERLRMDIAYIERRCFMLDIEILFRTVQSVIKGRGTH